MVLFIPTVRQAQQFIVFFPSPVASCGYRPGRDLREECEIAEEYTGVRPEPGPGRSHYDRPEMRPAMGKIYG